MTSVGCNCVIGSIGSTIAVITPVRNPWRPVRIAAREGEHSGVAQKLRKLTPFDAISARTGSDGAIGVAFQSKGGNDIWSMPMSSSTTTRMFGLVAPTRLGTATSANADEETTSVTAVVSSRMGITGGKARERNAMNNTASRARDDLFAIRRRLNNPLHDPLHDPLHGPLHEV